MNSVKKLEAHSLGPVLTAYTEQTIHLGCIDGCKNHVNKASMLSKSSVPGCTCTVNSLVCPYNDK